MKNRIMAYTFAASALLMSCTSNEVLEEVKDITESHDLMQFSNIHDSYQATRTDWSIPNLLKQNFLVSTYKGFGTANQQTVMPMYEVNYENYNSAYGQVSWNYISSESGHPFYQEQFEKYWDYSAFPYRFFAVSPAPLQGGALASGFTLTDSQLSIPMLYEYQTCTDGQTTAGAEPCLVAQVERTTTGRDYDLLAKEINGTAPKEINNSSQTKNRIVALPFHHLNCKVRFCIYCPDLGEGGEEHAVTDVTIKVRSKDFVTAAGYSASYDPASTLMNGTFVNPTIAETDDDVTLVRVTPEASQHGNNLYYDKDNGEPMVKYYFECENGLMQIPQDGVQISISFTVEGKFEETTYQLPASMMDFDGAVTTFKDVPIALQGTNQDTFLWEKNTYYTYNIILGPFITATPIYPVGGDTPIWFTCVVEPWQDIVGGIDTGLED